jgi:hypothetical protein
MTKNKVIYKLEKTISYPKQMKQLLRIRAQAEQETNTSTCVLDGLSSWYSTWFDIDIQHGSPSWNVSNIVKKRL